MPSFDVVSQVDLQEVDNAINQARKEITTRYDFKGSKSSIEVEKTDITLLAEDKMKLEAMADILKQKMVKRGIGTRALEFKDPEKASGDTLRQAVIVKQGIATDDGRKIVKLIKEHKFKVQAQIQEDQVRVTGPKRDELQKVIALIKSDIDLELQFINFRD